MALTSPQCHFVTKTPLTLSAHRRARHNEHLICSVYQELQKFSSRCWRVTRQSKALRCMHNTLSKLDAWKRASKWMLTGQSLVQDCQTLIRSLKIWTAPQPPASTSVFHTSILVIAPMSFNNQHALTEAAANTSDQAFRTCMCPGPERFYSPAALYPESLHHRQTSAHPYSNLLCCSTMWSSLNAPLASARSATWYETHKCQTAPSSPHDK